MLTCPLCQSEMSYRMLRDGTKVAPTPGDVGICCWCHSILITVEDGSFAELTAPALAMLEADDPRQVAAMRHTITMLKEMDRRATGGIVH